MECVEDSRALAAKDHERPSTYTLSRDFSRTLGPAYRMKEDGDVDCSFFPEQEKRTCFAVRGAETTLAKEDPTFVYLDVGCWADDADGSGTRRRDFGLVCGPHVYLCEYVGKPVVPNTRVPAVRDFFTGMANLGCGARVLGYAQARDVDRKTWEDSEVYLLLGDLHLPPAIWFHWPADLISPPPRPLPEWLERAPAMARQKDYRLHNHYDIASYKPSTYPVAALLAKVEMPDPNPWANTNPDISGGAGREAARFLRCVASLDQTLRSRLHFIQLGDLFELWIGRSYHLVPGADGNPKWRSPASADTVANWCLEVMVQNAPVFAALHRLQQAGLAEVRYLGGNHDGYLLQEDLPAQLALPRREPFYQGLHGDLMVEHGHRFDGSNHDNVKGTPLYSGPGVTRALLLFPWLRQLEGTKEDVWSLWQPRQRKLYHLGATVLYLYDRLELKRKPFSIYAMAHTHARILTRLHVRAKGRS
jgi:UDP-2,3-diacylglucosamine pyrophosphatase LpxH